MKIEILVWRDAKGRWWAEGSHDYTVEQARASVAEWSESDSAAEFIVQAVIPDPPPRAGAVRVAGTVQTP